ncbi:biogenesis of lysosome-related organelles complex 1 subunit 6 [Macrobrachium rosenbergii]|uniref:biogenesis of lysosome-related organelles complex 1 subunit 6 n=1 Tax=Macrobrachium rosenbergii TaxID=79674 RepID=UPI0034D55BBE
MAKEVPSEIFPPRDNSALRSQQGQGNQDVPPALAILKALIYEHHQKLAPIESKLKELLQNQQVLVEGLHGENERYKEMEANFSLSSLFAEVSMYSQKLKFLKGEMNNITDRTVRLKRRAMRLQQQQQQKALKFEQQRAQQAEREKFLIARPVWASQEDDKR